MISPYSVTRQRELAPSMSVASLSPLPFGADFEASEIQRIIDYGLAEDVGSGDVRSLS